MKISILGTEYDFEPSESRQDQRLATQDGYADYYTKTIRYENNYNENHPNAIKDHNALKNTVKRHEIIHAFLYESGAGEWANNEFITEWIAVQFPKLLKVFNEVNAI